MAVVYCKVGALLHHVAKRFRTKSQKLRGLSRWHQVGIFSYIKIVVFWAVRVVPLMTRAALRLFICLSRNSVEPSFLRIHRPSMCPSFSKHTSAASPRRGPQPTMMLRIAEWRTPLSREASG